MATEELIDEDLWQAIMLWLPPVRTDVRRGPPRVSNRAALAGILFVLRHGLAGPGVRQRRDLLATPAPVAGAGRLGRVHRTLLNWLGDLGVAEH